MRRVAVHTLLVALAVASRNHGNDVIFTNEPCDVFSQGTKFRPVDGDSSRYKQCGPVGYYWVLPCAPGTLFSTPHRGCMPIDLTTDSPLPPTTTTTTMMMTTTTDPPTTLTTSTSTLSVTTTVPDLVVFQLHNITKVPAGGAPIINDIPRVSPSLVSGDDEEAMRDLMTNEEQELFGPDDLSPLQPPPTNNGDMSMPVAPSSEDFVEPLVVQQTIRPKSPIQPMENLRSSTVAEYGFAIVDGPSPPTIDDNGPASSFLPGLAPAPMEEHLLPDENSYDTLPPPDRAIPEFLFTTESPPSTLAASVGNEEMSLVAPLDDRPLLFPLLKTTATPLTKVRLFRGCEIGGSCPFGSESNELFCYHPTDSHGYLQCSPDSDTQGEWVERFCPDTLIFMGDRCENAVRSTDLQTSPPRIHQVTMPSFTVSAPPPHQWQPEATPPRPTRPPTIAPHAANGWTPLPLLPPPSKRPLFPRVHPLPPPADLMLRLPLPPSHPHLQPEFVQPLPPPPVLTLPRTIDTAPVANIEIEILQNLEAMRSLQGSAGGGGGGGGYSPHNQQQIVLPPTREQIEMAQRELIDKFRAVERLESQGHVFPGIAPADLPLPAVARFSQDLEPVARRIAEYLAAQHPSVLAALMQSPGAVAVALQSPWAKELPAYLPKLAGAALRNFARLKTAPLPDDESAEKSADPMQDAICFQLQQLRPDSDDPSAFFMCVDAPPNSDQPRSNQKIGRWIRMLCPVGTVFKQSTNVCE